MQPHPSVRVAPPGHPVPLRAPVGPALAGYAEVRAADGVPRAVFPRAYAELLRIAAGVPAGVA
ncbi:hypothetical protein GA0070618_3862 [Micromonospora echinospora]|uniref:Uncharacterized protein n=1 Tax=Micromonospora echinospora TaxID=1877 RepID=A0A1C4YDF7_MICEC|nr:hypothetical protein GA0070618_3862 [Micromonospora echinospora]